MIVIIINYFCVSNTLLYYFYGMNDWVVWLEFGAGVEVDYPELPVLGKVTTGRALAEGVGAEVGRMNTGKDRKSVV